MKWNWNNVVNHWCFLAKQVLQLKTFVNFILVLQLTMALKRCVLWLSYEINNFCYFNSIFIKSTVCMLFSVPGSDSVSLFLYCLSRFYFISFRVESPGQIQLFTPSQLSLSRQTIHVHCSIHKDFTNDLPLFSHF